MSNVLGRQDSLMERAVLVIIVVLSVKIILLYESPNREMPYIDPAGRARAWIAPEGAGPLCYALSKQVNDYRLRQGDSFATFAEILAALESTKLEFYRRVVAPYEQKKMEEYGDVF